MPLSIVYWPFPMFWCLQNNWGFIFLKLRQVFLGHKVLGLVLRENKSHPQFWVMSILFWLLVSVDLLSSLSGHPLILYGENMLRSWQKAKKKWCMSIPTGLKRQRKKGIQITVFENGLTTWVNWVFQFLFSAMSLLVDRVCFLHLPFSKKNTSGNVSMLLLS